MTNLVVDVLNNPREYEKLKKAALYNYSTRFRPEIMSEAYDRLYKEIYDVTDRS